MTLKRTADTEPSFKYECRVGGRGDSGEDLSVNWVGAITSADLGVSSK